MEVGDSDIGESDAGESDAGETSTERETDGASSACGVVASTDLVVSVGDVGGVFGVGE